MTLTLKFFINFQALSCLVQIASVRRSLFTNTERAKFLTHLVNGVKHILQNPQGLSDPSNYHEFCRLLARLKSNYQLGELVTVENYPEAIQLVAKFTVESLQVCLVKFLMFLENFWPKLNFFLVDFRCGNLPRIVSIIFLVCGNEWLRLYRTLKRRNLIYLRFIHLK